MEVTGRITTALVLILLVGVSLAAVSYFYKAAPQTGGSNVRDFVIVASINGFNGSALSPYSENGVQQTPWPVIQVAKGTLVNITIVNEDKQTHSFQVTHYFDSAIHTIAPGQTLVVSFVANETGTFSIKCVILCSIHWAMQNGELIVV